MCQVKCSGLLCIQLDSFEKGFNWLNQNHPEVLFAVDRSVGPLKLGSHHTDRDYAWGISDAEEDGHYPEPGSEEEKSCKFEDCKLRTVLHKKPASECEKVSKKGELVGRR